MLIKKRGDISISFDMIFSIIIIVAVIGAASYALVYFLDFKKCSQVGLFYQEFQKKIDSAWNSDIVNDVYAGSLPSSIQKVCVGNLTLADQSTPEYKNLRNYVIKEANLFLYPGQGACDIPYKQLKHVNLTGFVCAALRGGEVSFKLAKQEDESLVRVCNPTDTGCLTRVQPTPTNGQNEEPNLETSDQVCQKASNANLCDGLTLVYDSNYKMRCCSKYQLCC
jgi:hypothetical protein